MCKCNCNKPDSRFVYYIDVGNLPRSAAEDYMKVVTEKFREQLPAHEKNSWLYIPVRDGNSRVERL
jgi:hypothetical protein